jgi:multidrug efflux pump subunit AcrA (membrane-fusion protein)
MAGMNLSGSDVELKFIRIVTPDSLYFEAKIDEVDYSKVKLNQEVIVNVDAYPGKNCSGKVSFVGRDGQETTGGVVTIPAEITFTECNLEYAVGLNGQAHFVLSKLDNVLVIPKKYIVNKEGKDFVWKQTGSSTKSRKLTPIKVGTTTSVDAEVLEGLSEGDLVIFIPQN